jgi:hypothetical protein
MNILKHKSWHVYSEKNRERVRKDEKELAEQEERERERRLLADKERRLVELRGKGKSGGGDNGPGKEENDGAASTSGTSIYSGNHINFWASMEDGPGPQKTGNVEHDEDKRKEREAADKKTTMYLFKGWLSSG